MVDRVDLQTFFAPVDDSFAGFNGNPETVQHLLLQHMLNGASRSEDLRQQREVTVMSGGRLPIHSDDYGLRIGEARVVRADVACTNGVIHVVDNLLAKRASPK